MRTSPANNPFFRSLGLIEKMGEGFAQAMDDDFNSRDAIGKILGAVREITKTLDSGLDEADMHAFTAHYAVDLLEGNPQERYSVFFLLERWHLLNPKKTQGGQKLQTKLNCY